MDKEYKAKQKLIDSIEKRLSDRDRDIVMRLFGNGTEDVYNAAIPNFLCSAPEMQIVLAHKFIQFIENRIHNTITMLLEGEIKVESAGEYKTDYGVTYKGNYFIVTPENYQDNYLPVELTREEKDAIFGAIYRFKEKEKNAK